MLKAWGNELERGTVLEIGGGTDGIARYLNNSVTGLEVHGVRPAVENLGIVAGSISEIPYPDGAFDFVVCTDALGQLPAAKRRRAVSEIIRVAKTACFILGPHGDIALNAEKMFADTLVRKGMALPPWLKAHLQNGLPSVSETVTAVLDAGFIPSIRKNEGIVEHFSSFPEALHIPQIRHLRVIAESKAPHSASSAAEADVPYSLLITVDRNRPVRNVVDPFLSEVRPMATDERTHGGRDGRTPSIFSAHHKPTRLMGVFKLIRTFDVTGQMPDAEMSLKEPHGFFEERNDRCSELSAIHYIWRKKLFGDIVGFCHYRRYLYPFPEDVKEAEIKLDVEQVAALRPRIEDTDRIGALLDQNDVLTARPLKLDSMRQEDQFSLAHYADDYFSLVECMIDRYPLLGPALNESMNATELYATNMIVCRKELFDIFCRVWFDILECCAGRIEPAGRSAYQARDIAFLSERVFDTLVRHLKLSGFRVCELPRIFVEI